jgi:hypothetical protein
MNILLALLLFPCLAQAQDSSPWTVFQVEMAMADRLQDKVLDRILGAGQSAAFVTMEVEFDTSEDSSLRNGVGMVEKFKSKGVNISTGEFISDELSRDLSNQYSTGTVAGTKELLADRSGAAQFQKAHQIKGLREVKVAVHRVARQLQDS